MSFFKKCILCIRYSISNYLVKSTFNTHSWQPVLFDCEGGAHFYLSLEVKKEKRFIWHIFLSFIMDLKDIQTWWLNVFYPHLQRKTRLRVLKKKSFLPPWWLVLEMKKSRSMNINVLIMALKESEASFITSDIPFAHICGYSRWLR